MGKESVSRRAGRKCPGRRYRETRPIADSPQFRSSKRCSLFLRYVVQHAIDHELDCLKERTLGIDVFDRDPNYDTNQDPVVRTAAGEVRKRLASIISSPAMRTNCCSACRRRLHSRIPADQTPTETRIETTCSASRVAGGWGMVRALPASWRARGGFTLFPGRPTRPVLGSVDESPRPRAWCERDSPRPIASTAIPSMPWMSGSRSLSESPTLRRNLRDSVVAFVPMWDRYAGFGDAQRWRGFLAVWSIR